MDPRNTHEKKIWTHERPTRKNSDQGNNHEKKCWTQEIPTRKNLGPKKYPREKMSDQRRHQWHETHQIQDDTRPTEFSTLSLWFSFGWFAHYKQIVYYLHSHTFAKIYDETLQFVRWANFWISITSVTISTRRARMT